MLNLAAKTRDAMPKGGKLTIRSHVEGDEVAIEVLDTGEGMSADVQRHIFDPFYTTKSPGKGTGLGLSMVHAIVDEAGGTIEVASKQGEGTRFTLRFPHTGESTEHSTANRQRRYELEGRGRHILIAEDNEGVRGLVRKPFTERELFERVDAKLRGCEAHHPDASDSGHEAAE